MPKPRTCGAEFVEKRRFGVPHRRIDAMFRKLESTEKQPNTWTRGGQAKSSDVAAALAKVLGPDAPKQNQPK